MKDLLVEDLIERLKGVNPKAKVQVVAFCLPQEFSLCHGGSDGCTEADCNDFTFYCDALCTQEALRKDRS